MVQTKANQDNVGESFKHYEIKESKAESENTRKIHDLNICGILCMCEDLFVSNIHIHWTINECENHSNQL